MERWLDYVLVESLGRTEVSERWRAFVRTPGGLIHPVLVERAIHGQNDLVNEGARVANELRHPSLLAIHELHPHDGGAAYRFSPGRCLGEILDATRQRDLPFDEAAALFVGIQLLEALDHLHERLDMAGSPLNIVHRDINPNAIWLRYDVSVELGDFHYATHKGRPRAMRPGGDQPRFGYASPEAALEGHEDRRSDIYSVSLVLYELLAGRPAYAERVPDALKRRATRGEVTPLLQIAPSVPSDAAQAIMRGLTFDRNQRPASASALRDALSVALRSRNPTFASDQLSRYVKTLMSREAAQDRRRDAEAFVEMSARSNHSMISALPSPEPVHSSQPAPVAHHAPARQVPSNPPQAAPAPMPASEVAARRASTSVPPPPLKDGPGLPIGKIAAGLGLVAVLGLVAFTFSSGDNSSYMQRKLRAAIMGRKPGATLTIDSIPPGATVFLDGENTGRTTPITVENVESELVHSVRLELNGEPAETSTVTLVAGTKKTLNMTFKNAMVNAMFATDPEGAEIYLNGRHVALAPATMTLKTGEEVKFEFRRLGYISQEKVFTPKRGESINLTIKLEKSEEMLAQEAAVKAAEEEAAAEAQPKKKKRRRRRRRR